MVAEDLPKADELSSGGITFQANIGTDLLVYFLDFFVRKLDEWQMKLEQIESAYFLWLQKNYQFLGFDDAVFPFLNADLKSAIQSGGWLK